MSKTSTGTVIPGTVHLVDLQGTLAVKHAKGKSLADVVLVPAPSNDPDDPLNWSPRRKLMSTIALTVYLLMIGLAVSCVYSIIVPISDATGLSIADLNAGTGYQFLMMGWGCLLWQPAAQSFGKRPVYLLSLFLSIAVTVTVPYVRTSGAWWGSKVAQGILAAPSEALAEITISDVYFSHQRGTYMAVYALVLYVAGFLAPVFSGFINDGMGWEWVQYWCAIWLAIGFVFCFFFMEETNYVRHSILTDEEQLAAASSTHRTDQESKFHGDEAPTKLEEEESVEHVQIRPQGQTKSFVAKLALIDKPKPLRHFFAGVLRPIKLLRFPIIVYCGFMYGASLIWFNILNATSSLILSGPPYHFAPSMVGLTYFGPIIGVCIGALLSGSLADMLVLRLARRNNGIWMSEQRLWFYLVLVITVPWAMIQWGVGASHGIHWFGLVFAMGLVGLCCVIAAQLPISYCIDTYKDLGADAIVSVILVRNTMSFAIGYGVTPWVVNLGYQNSFLIAGFAGLAQVLTFLIFVKWGPKMRAASADQYRREVQIAHELGISH